MGKYALGGVLRSMNDGFDHAWEQSEREEGHAHKLFWTPFDCFEEPCEWPHDECPFPSCPHRVESSK